MILPRTALFLLALATACSSVTTTPTAPSPIAPRVTVSLADAFSFRVTDDAFAGQTIGADETGFQRVKLPHTFDDSASPFFTTKNAWYRAHVRLPDDAPDRHWLLHFEGVGTIARVYVDGRDVGTHRGAYTGFLFDVTSALAPGADHVIAVRVDNTDDDTEDCLPSRCLARGYFRPWGGIYRKAELVGARALRIGDEAYAASGVVFETSDVGEASAHVDARVRIVNDGAFAEHGQIRITLSHNGTSVTELDAPFDVAGAATTEITIPATVVRPALWDLRKPELYDATVELVDSFGVRDRVRERFGFRRFEHAAGTYLLNGRPIALRGISKHHESEQSFAAMTDDEFRAEWSDLVDLGVNFVRLVHYPHAKIEYDLADEKGLLVWAENGNSAPWPGTDTGDRITREMVRQNRNHPSVVMWSAGNEADGDAAAHDAIVRYAKVAKTEDPARLAVYASNSGFFDASLDVIPVNVYPGWYGGDVWDFEKYLPATRDFSETGGRSVVTQHIDYADARLDLGTFEPEEYLQRLAESRMHVAFRSHASDVSMFTWWVYRDFVLDGRPKGINDSGIVSFDGRRKKDSYFLFRSFLRPEEPLVHLASKAYFVRRNRPDNGIKAYANVKRLRLFIDGVDQGTRDNGAFEHTKGRFVDNVFYWPALLHQGQNHVRVTDDAGHDDTATIVFDGTGGLPPIAGAPIVSSVTSTNPANRAVFFDGTISPGFPVFTDLDGTADNSWVTVPPELATARPIATRRTSKPSFSTSLAFTVRANAASVAILVAATDGAKVDLPGFTDLGLRGTWRDDTMRPTPMRLYSRASTGGETVTIPAQGPIDYAVLVSE